MCTFEFYEFYQKFTYSTDLEMTITTPRRMIKYYSALFG